MYTLYSKSLERQTSEVAYPQLLHILKFLNGAKPGMPSQSKASYLSSNSSSVIVNEYRTEASDPDPMKPQPWIGEATHPDCRGNIKDSKKNDRRLASSPQEIS
jgi:hypothetical protein